MLKMKSKCERCGDAVGATAEAYICSFECTFCSVCTEGMSHVCPNCSGELARRPTRTRNMVEVAADQLKRKLSGDRDK